MKTSLPSPMGISQQVYRTLERYLQRDSSTLHPEDSLRDDLGLDSLQTIELVYEVESEFDIQIPDEDFGRLTTIGDVVVYLSERAQPFPNVQPTHATPQLKTHAVSVPPQTKPTIPSKKTHL